MRLPYGIATKAWQCVIGCSPPMTARQVATAAGNLLDGQAHNGLPDWMRV
jgi:hypothetical protein